jgi:hypothetical protein
MTEETIEFKTFMSSDKPCVERDDFTFIDIPVSNSFSPVTGIQNNWILQEETD